MPDLHERLTAEVTRRLAVARAASQTEDGSTQGGEHWQWVCNTCDTAVVVNDVVLLDEHVECCSRSEFDLRSVEHYETRHVGPLPHMAVRYVQELRPVDALHVQISASPAAAVRRWERELRLLERHSLCPRACDLHNMHPQNWCHACDAGAPCREVRELAEVLEISSTTP